MAFAIFEGGKLEFRRLIAAFSDSLVDLTKSFINRQVLTHDTNLW